MTLKLLLIFLFFIIPLNPCRPSVVKVGIIADVHYPDSVDDVAYRIFGVAEGWTKEAIVKWESWGVDFGIQLGDYCNDHYPYPSHSWRSKKNCLAIQEYFMNHIWVSDVIPLYNVLGNHEIGNAPKTKALELWHLPESPAVAYYSFDVGAFHFIVLDTMDYECANKTVGEKIAKYFRISDVQMRWLKWDLKRSHKPTFIFAHVPISGRFWNTTREYLKVKNAPELWSLFESDGDVVACFEGHKHYVIGDPAYHWRWRNGSVHYFQMNCLTHKLCKRATGYLTLDPINHKFIWEVISDKFTKHYEFEWECALHR